MEGIQTVLPLGKQQLVREFIESFELEGSFKGHLVHFPSNEQGHLHLIRLLRAWSSLILNASMTLISLGIFW